MGSLRSLFDSTSSPSHSRLLLQLLLTSRRHHIDGQLRLAVLSRRLYSLVHLQRCVMPLYRRWFVDRLCGHLGEQTHILGFVPQRVLLQAKGAGGWALWVVTVAALSRKDSFIGGGTGTNPVVNLRWVIFCFELQRRPCFHRRLSFLLTWFNFIFKTLSILQVLKDFTAHCYWFVILIYIFFGTASFEDRTDIWDLGKKLQNWNQFNQFSICAIIVPA